MRGTKEAHGKHEMISCSAPQWPICVSSALWFRDHLCVSCHQWFGVEAGLGCRSKCVIRGLGLIFGSASVSLPSSRSIHMSHHSVHANRMRLFLINLLWASLQQIVFFDSTVKIILSTEPQPNMSSQHAPWEEDRKCGENRKSRTIQEGQTLEKLLERYTSYTQVLSAPCLLLRRVQPFLFSATPSLYFILGHSSPVTCFGNAIIC